MRGEKRLLFPALALALALIVLSGLCACATAPSSQSQDVSAGTESAAEPSAVPSDASEDSPDPGTEAASEDDPDPGTEAASEDDPDPEPESSSETDPGTDGSPDQPDSSSESDSGVSRESPVTDDTIDAQETDGEFTIQTSGGTFRKTETGYTLSAAGTYVLSGYFEGQILVNAGESDEIVIELNGLTITYGKDSPIKIVSSGDVEISAKSGTENVVNDTRSAKTADDANQGEGAIYAKADLKLKGTGTLEINASYNNGVHTTKDLTIQKLSLKVTAPNNAIKGNDSITVRSGTVVAISTMGDGAISSFLPARADLPRSSSLPDPTAATPRPPRRRPRTRASKCRTSSISEAARLISRATTTDCTPITERDSRPAKPAWEPSTSPAEP